MKTWQGRDKAVTVTRVTTDGKPELRPLAEYLLILRESRGLTQAQAASASGVQTRQWQRWETAQSEPYLSNLTKLAEGLDVPLEDVVTLRPPKSRPRPAEEVAQLDRIERKVTILVALMRGQELSAEAWTAAEEALQLADLPLPKPRRERS